MVTGHPVKTREDIRTLKIPINLDLDRQMLPFATPASIEAHIRECVEALYLPQGGLGIVLELGPDVGLDVIETALKALEKYRHYPGIE